MYVIKKQTWPPHHHMWPASPRPSTSMFACCCQAVLGTNVHPLTRLECTAQLYVFLSRLCVAKCYYVLLRIAWLLCPLKARCLLIWKPHCGKQLCLLWVCTYSRTPFLHCLLALASRTLSSVLLLCPRTLSLDKSNHHWLWAVTHQTTPTSLNRARLRRHGSYTLPT